MIFLAFILPLAVYLLVLGALNRRGRPVMVAGTWDFIGLLFAASGFLLCIGPAVLTSLNERWRLFWLFGESGAARDPEGAWQFWVLLSALYFVAVVALSAWGLWRQRRVTSVYNVELWMVEQALAGACERLGLRPLRSGNLFLFGVNLGGRAERRGGEGVQAPHFAPADEKSLAARRPASDVRNQTASLEVDCFPLTRHVSLRWDPADSPLRREVEAEVGGELAEGVAVEHDLGFWLIVTGCFLLVLWVLAALALFLRHLLVG